MQYRTIDSSFEQFLSYFRTNKFSNSSEKNPVLTLETLEDRLMLSGSGFESSDTIEFATKTGDASQAVFSSGATLAEQATSELQQVVISSVALKVNGEAVTVANSYDTLRLNSGDVVEVTGVNFLVHESINADGVFSAEGYISKLTDAPTGSTPDYSDGRFASRELNQSAIAGDITIAGLDGSWTIEDGWDRLTISLVHYFGNDSQHMASFGVKLQVGDPDFVVDKSVADQFGDGSSIKAGEVFDIHGSWSNTGNGFYFNYSEVDIFNASTGEVEWVGVTVGKAGFDQVVSGEYLNTNANDPFAERWVPTENSDYVVKFFADPENTWRETNEGNNVVEVRFSVGSNEPNTPLVSDDAFSGLRRDFRKLDVVANDGGEDLKIVKVTQGEHGKVHVRIDGKIGYKASRGFVGSDKFTYTVVDAEGNSETATVEIEVLSKGIKVADVSGKVGEKIKLEIALDTERFDAVMIKGVHIMKAELTVGERQKNGSYIVSADELDDLAIVSEKKHKGFKLRFRSMSNGEKRSFARANVTVESTPRLVDDRVELQELNTTFQTELKDVISTSEDSKDTIVVNDVPDCYDLTGGVFSNGCWKISKDKINDLKLNLKDGLEWKKDAVKDCTFRFSFESSDRQSQVSKPGFKFRKFDVDGIANSFKKIWGRFRSA